MKWMVPTRGSSELRWKEGVFMPLQLPISDLRPAHSDPSVATSLVDDVYLSLVAIPRKKDVVVVRVLVEPLVGWIWVGVL